MTQQLTRWIAISAAVFGLLQIALGAPLVMVLALVATTLVTLAPVRTFGLSHIVGMLFFVMCLYFGYNALALPSLFLRSAATELFVPELSSGVVFAFAAAASAGALAVRILFPNLPLLVRPITEPQTLRKIALTALALGLLGTWLNMREGIAVSIGAFLSPYLFLAFALELSATLSESQGRRSISPLGGLIIASIVVATTVANSKAGLLVAAGGWMVANLAYGRRFRWSVIVSLALLGAVLSYMFLAINMVRAHREEVVGIELVTMTMETAGALATGDPYALAELERMRADNVSRNLAFYSLLYFEGLPVLAERFVLLPYADAILRAVPPDGPFAGLSFITDQFASLLPSFLNPDKDPAYVGNVIVVNLDLGAADFNGYPTMGMAAELFYAGGFPMVVALSVVLFFALTAALSVTVGRINGSAFAIYVVIRYVHFLNVGTSSSIIFFLGRQLPVDVAFIFVAAWLAGHGRARPARFAT